MATKSESREERRRRILERESDRMALITGHIKKLSPCPSPPPSPIPSSPSSSSASYPHRRPSLAQLPPSLFSQNHSPAAGINDGDFKAKNGISGPQLLNYEGDDEIHKFRYYDKDGGAVANLDLSTTRQPSSPHLEVQPASINLKPPSSQKRASRSQFFTSKRMNSSIIESQNTRVICSLIIALLVVLSYVDYPLFGRNLVRSESVVASRPLYILQLTEITIVIARIFLERRRDGGEAEEEGDECREDQHNWAAAERVLERGLVVYQSVRGIFIDFSIYAVIIICGLSLV